MNITISRLPQDPHSTPGKLSLDGVYFCRTLEPPATGLYPRIPAGRYTISLRPSPEFQRRAQEEDWYRAYCDKMPHIDYKPNSITMIHPGNTPEDTKDCILVGRVAATDWVSGSRNAFEDLWPRLKDGDTVEVVDAPNDAEDVRDAATAT